MQPSLPSVPVLCVFALVCAGCTLDTEGQGAWDGLVAPDSGIDSSAWPDAGLPDSSDAGHDAWDGDTSADEGIEADAVDAPEEGDACVPETDAVFCARYAKDCGEYTDDDNCGAGRTASCGTCDTGTTCGGDGRPNVCGWWWDCDWTTRRRVSVKAPGALPRGYSVPVRFDHAALVAASRSLPSGDDVRVVAWDGFSWTEQDRVLDPDSAWNRGDTTIWLGTRAPMAAGETADYYLFTGNATPPAPPANVRAVFAMADFFERSDSTDPGNDWILWEDTGTDVAVRGGELWLDSTDQNNRPVADAPFDCIADGLEWRMGLDWARTGEEGWYRVHLQLGDSAVMEKPPAATDYFSNAGAGPSLLWAGLNNGMTSNEGLGWEAAGATTQIAQISGKHRLRSVVSVATDTYSVEVDGASVASDVPFSSDVSCLDRLRLMVWQVNSANFARRAFDYVIVRRLVAPEPTLALGAFQAGSCP